MRLVSASVSIEFQKILLRQKYRVILILEVIAAFVLGFFGTGSKTLNFNFFSIDLPNIHLTVLGFMTTIVLPLIIFMLTADLLASESENGSIKCVLLRPISRLKVYISKIIAIIGYVILNLVTMCIIFMLIKVVLKGSFSGVGTAFSSYLISIVPLAAFVFLAAFVTQLAGNASLSMFICLVTYLLMGAAGIVSTPIGSILFTSYTGWYKMWIGAMLPASSLVATSFLLLSYMAIFFIVGYLFFDKREV